MQDLSARTTPSPRNSLTLSRPSRASTGSSAGGGGGGGGGGVRAHTFKRPPAVEPPPAFVGGEAAEDHVRDQFVKRLIKEDELDEETAEEQISRVIYSDGALRLINGFIDQLLYSILANARTTRRDAYYPILDRVLTTSVATHAIAAAQEELHVLMGDSEDESDEEMDSQDQQWDQDLMWKRIRLNIMVYMDLGEFEDEDEERYVQEHHLEHALYSWSTVVWLAAALEWIAHQCVAIAGQSAWERVIKDWRAKQARVGDDPDALDNIAAFDETDDREIIVEERDAERIAIAMPVGKLWRQWRRSQRNTVLLLPGSASPRTSRSGKFPPPRISTNRLSGFSTTSNQNRWSNPRSAASAAIVDPESGSARAPSETSEPPRSGSLDLTSRQDSPYKAQHEQHVTSEDRSVADEVDPAAESEPPVRQLPTHRKKRFPIAEVPDAEEKAAEAVQGGPEEDSSQTHSAEHETPHVPSQELLQEPPQEPTSKPSQETLREPAQKPTQEPSQETLREVARKSSQDPIAETTGQDIPSIEQIHETTATPVDGEEANRKAEDAEADDTVGPLPPSMKRLSRQSYTGVEIPDGEELDASEQSITKEVPQPVNHTKETRIANHTAVAEKVAAFEKSAEREPTTVKTVEKKSSQNKLASRKSIFSEDIDGESSQQLREPTLEPHQIDDLAKAQIRSKPDTAIEQKKHIEIPKEHVAPLPEEETLQVQSKEMVDQEDDDTLSNMVTDWKSRDERDASLLMPETGINGSSARASSPKAKPGSTLTVDVDGSQPSSRDGSRQPSPKPTFADDRSSVKRLPSRPESAAGSSPTSHQHKPTDSFSKLSQKSSPTSENRKNSIAFSSASRHSSMTPSNIDFDELMSQGETVKYTLTPHNLRELTNASPPKVSPAPSPAPVIPQPAVPESVINNTATMRSSISEDNIRSTAFSEQQPPADSVLRHTRSGVIPRAPADLPEEVFKVTKHGIIRDARIRTENTRDLADYIRSTGPSAKAEAQMIQPFVLSGHTSSKGSNDLGANDLGAKSTPVSAYMSSKNSMDLNEAGHVRPMSLSLSGSPHRLQLEPRGPVIRNDQVTKELIALMRENPRILASVNGHANGNGSIGRASDVGTLPTLSEENVDFETIAQASFSDSLFSDGLWNADASVLTTTIPQEISAQFTPQDQSSFQSSTSRKTEQPSKPRVHRKTGRPIHDLYALPSDDEDEDVASVATRTTAPATVDDGQDLNDFLKSMATKKPTISTKLEKKSFDRSSDRASQETTGSRSILSRSSTTKAKNKENRTSLLGRFRRNA